ncbi:MAG: hypothetical protein RR279_02790 [Alistipes sp.]
MKKHIYLFTCVTAFVLLFASTGCSDDPTPTPPIPPPAEAAFDIKLNNITHTSVVISVTPKDQTSPYYSHILAKAAFEKNWHSSVSELMADYIAYLCEEHSLTKEEVITELLTTGNDEWSYDKMTANTEYVVFAVGMDKTGAFTTEPTMKEFKSAALDPVVPVDCTFALTVADITSTRAKISVVPSKKEVPYFYDLIPATSYPTGDPTEFLTDFVKNAVQQVMDQYGASFDDALQFLTATGDDITDLTPGSLKPETTYKAVAFGIDQYGRPTTAPATKEFKTLAVKPSANTFTVAINDITAVNAVAHITPSNNDPYYVGLFTQAKLAGRTDAEIIESILAQGPIYATSTGEKDMDWGNRLLSATAYEVLVFGYNEGVTTSVTHTKFTTLSGGNPALCTFQANVQPEGFTVNLNMTPSDNTVFYLYGMILKAEYPSDEEIMNTTKTDLENISKESGFSIPEVMLDMCPRGPASATIPVTSLGEYIIYAYALNLDGSPATAMHKQDYTAPEVKVSTATASVEVVKFYSGLELYNYDKEKYPEGKDNYAYMVTKVHHSADAVNWYAAIFAGDQTNTSDASMIANLVDYGGGEHNVDHLSYCWASFFDVEYYGSAGAKNSLCAVAIDKDGVYGPIFKEVFMPLSTDASPISEITGSHRFGKGLRPAALCVKQPSLHRSFLPNKPFTKHNLVFRTSEQPTKVTSVVAQQKPDAKKEPLHRTSQFGTGKTLLMR